MTHPEASPDGTGTQTDEVKAALDQLGFIAGIFRDEGRAASAAILLRHASVLSAEIERLTRRVEELTDFYRLHADKVALASAAAPDERWQDIATAPKDGTHILARGVRGEASPPTTVHWFGPPDLPGLRAGGWYISVQQDEGPKVHPTRWMPLPPDQDTAPNPTPKDGRAPTDPQGRRHVGPIVGYGTPPHE